MHHWYLVHPEYRSYLDQALQGRAEAQGRAVYLAIVGAEAVGRFAIRHLVAGLRHGAAALDRWHRRRQTVQALSRLDGRMLRDVGLHAGDIERVADELTRPPTAKRAPASAVPYRTAVPKLRLDLDCLELRTAA